MPPVDQLTIDDATVTKLDATTPRLETGDYWKDQRLAEIARLSGEAAVHNALNAQAAGFANPEAPFDDEAITSSVAAGIAVDEMDAPIAAPAAAVALGPNTSGDLGVSDAAPVTAQHSDLSDTPSHEQVDAHELQEPETIEHQDAYDGTQIAAQTEIPHDPYDLLAVPALPEDSTEAYNPLHDPELAAQLQYLEDARAAVEAARVTSAAEAAGIK